MQDRKPVAFDMSLPLIARLERWMKRQPFAPKKRTVLETAISEFLDRQEAAEKKRGAK